MVYLSERFLGQAKSIQAVGVPNGDGAIGEVHVGMQHADGWSALTYSTGTAPFQIGMTVYGAKRTLEADLIF